MSDLGNLRGRHSVIEIRDEGYDSIRRTVSMDHSFQRGSGLSIADVLHVNQEHEGCSNGAGPSKNSRGESSKSSYTSSVRVGFMINLPSTRAILTSEIISLMGISDTASAAEAARQAIESGIISASLEMRETSTCTSQK